MRKSIFSLMILICCQLLTACGNERNSEKKVIADILAGEDQDTIGMRYDSMTGSTRYVSCSVYREFSEEAMEELGKALYEQVSMEGNGPVSKCSMVFYEKDSGLQLYAFYYTKDGVSLNTKNAYYVPGDVFELFEPEG